jgi:hypothetical protein
VPASRTVPLVDASVLTDVVSTDDAAAGLDSRWSVASAAAGSPGSALTPRYHAGRGGRAAAARSAASVEGLSGELVAGEGEAVPAAAPAEDLPAFGFWASGAWAFGFWASGA